MQMGMKTQRNGAQMLLTQFDDAPLCDVFVLSFFAVCLCLQ